MSPPAAALAKAAFSNETTSSRLAYQAGADAAAPLVGLVREMSLYRVRHDSDDVAGRLADEVHMHPDQRLDALGWDIYLLDAVFTHVTRQRP